MQYELSYVCQAKCTFCYNPSRVRALPEMDRVWRIVESIKEARVPHVQLIGGEVSLIPELAAIVESLSGRSAVTFVTNAIKKIKPPEGILGMFISLHGSTRQIHEDLTNTPGTYDMICENIAAYVDEGMDVSADVLLTAQNHRDVYGIIGKAHDLGMSRVYINRFEPGGMGADACEHLMPKLEEFREAVTQILAARKEFGIDVLFGTAIPFCADPRLISDGMATPDCGAGSWFGAINPAGEFRICNQASYPIGSVLDSPLEELWNSRSNKYLSSYRSLDWAEEPCRSCPVLEECSGGCRIDSTCNSERIAHIDYYLRYMGLKPDYKQMEALKGDLLKRRMPSYATPADSELVINQRMRMVDRSPEEHYLVNLDAGVVKVSNGVKALIESAMRNPNRAAAMNDAHLNLLAELSVLVSREKKVSMGSKARA